LVLCLAQFALGSKFIHMAELAKRYKTTADILDDDRQRQRLTDMDMVLGQDWLAEHAHIHPHERRRGGRPNGRNRRRQSD
jgi:hypothetical protein